MSYIDEAIQTKSDQFHGELVPLSYVQALAVGIVNRIEELDRIKKALFYGKPFMPGPHSYACDHLPAFINGAAGSHAQAVDLIHGILGKVTESGELLEALLKCIKGDEGLDLVNLLEEVGDGQWYDAIICNALGTTFERVQQVNIEKLRARFPQKFQAFDANNRDLDAERAILEGVEPFQVQVNTVDGKHYVVPGAGAEIKDSLVKLEDYKVEIKDDPRGFRFRLMHSPSGRVTAWASYLQFAMLDEVAAATDYYLANGNEIKPMLAADVLRGVAVQEAKVEQIFDPSC